MIHAVFAERPEQMLFTCDGHAGGDKGSDIVCAAVSTAVELMRRMLVPDVCEEKDGAVKMEIDQPQELRDRICIAGDWGVFQQFFVDMEKKYPDRVRVTVM